MKTLIAIPCMDMVHTLFFTSVLGMDKMGSAEVSVCASSLVYDSRNKLAHKAVSEGFDRVLWLDSDMRFDPDLLSRLSAHLDAGKEMVCGLYFTRKAPVVPCVYSALEIVDGVPTAPPIHDFPKDQLFQVAGCGFGAVLMTADLIRRVADRFGGLPFSPVAGFGEDFSFCLRAREIGAEIWCDPTVRADHLGVALFNESTYLQAKEAQTNA